MKEQESTNKVDAGKRSRLTDQEIRQAFVACLRCGLFLSGYSLIHDDLDTSIQNNSGKWLDLTWSMETRRLVQKSYGVTIRQADSHFEGVCTDCRRVFVYSTVESDPPQYSFSVKISPSP